jgi:hypothetical protein
MNDNKEPIVVEINDIHTEFRKQIMINFVLAALAIYFFKLTANYAAFMCLISSVMIMLINVYYKKKLSNVEYVAAFGEINILTAMLKNSITSMAWAVLSCMLFIIGTFDIPALIKPYMNF